MFRLPVPPVVLVVCLGVSACSGSSEAGGSVQVATTAEESQASSASTTTEDKSVTSLASTTVPTTTDPAEESVTTTLDLELDGDLQAVDPDWNELSRPYLVYGVEEDDRLNLRSGPGLASEVVASIGFTSSELTVYDEVIFVGSDRWSPVRLGTNDDGAVGWANLAFLRPQSGDADLAFEGSTDNAVLSWANEVSELLWSPERVADFVGPDGVIVSTDAFIDPEDLVLSERDLRNPSDEMVLWGYEDGSGESITRTLIEQFNLMQGSTALTSTDVIGIDTEIGWSNTINNVAEVFPGATVIEYHFAGTEDYANLDWTSIRLVFETTEGVAQPVLVAIVQAGWTI